MFLSEFTNFLLNLIWDLSHLVVEQFLFIFSCVLGINVLLENKSPPELESIC